ncbi:uncharacterized protein LOC124544203 [Vanessa cardui]|uniref:uncharacterized protein LOC124544203 n=1 Tax=Vanessa cardui TaxID=171605 RepID=UPI001F12D257|nr:uncharacterized protein LOC124544203 [Vanessa cardui]
MRTSLPDTCGGTGCAQDLRKTSVIDAELARLNISISALQETRLPQNGFIKENHYTFFWVGKDQQEHREHGVGFAVRNDLLSSIQTPQGISERIMVLRLLSNCGFVTLICAYAPTLSTTSEVKDRFYDQLTQTIVAVPASDHLYILGDFNARVGQDNVAWPDCLGNHGVGKMNENGQRLLEFCSNHKICVTNTYFKGKFMHKVSWKHPRSGHWHQLDLILTRRKDIRFVLHTRTYQSADCDTDHSLVVSKTAMVRKRIFSSRTPGNKKIDLTQIRIGKKVESFKELVCSKTLSWDQNAPLQEEWDRVKEILTESAGKAFGYRRTNTEDWFSQNIEHLEPMLESKRLAALNHRLDPSSSTLKVLTEAKSRCADSGDFSGVCGGIKKTLGPVPKKIAPLKELDGTVISDSNRQMQRWVEHYTGLYSQPTSIEPQIKILIPKLPTWYELDDDPTVEQFQTAIKQLKCGKSPGRDYIYPELLKLDFIAPLMYTLLIKCWAEGTVPQDMRDANIITLYKGKGDRGDCNSYRGISLLSVVGKLIGRVILSKLQCLANRVYPEAQCGFRAGRSTTDMIFTLRQIQEKCREQQTPLIIAFVDLNKAFDTVSREGLFELLEIVGCPPKLLKLIRSFHEETKGSAVFDGKMSEPFDMRRGVRQGCVLAPTLFGIFFSLLLKVACGDKQQGVHLHTRIDGKLFNIALLKSKRNRVDMFADSLLFADDAAFIATSSYELQTMMDKFSHACNLFSMSINAKKTLIFAQGFAEKPVILLHGVPLDVVNKFCYLGSTVTSNLSLSADIDIRIGKAATMFGKLRTRVWDNNHLTVRTKILVYQAWILSILLYGAETWTSYAKQEYRLNAFHMRCVRNILGVTWKDRITNKAILTKAQLPSLSALLKQRRLRWVGHVHRMDASRLPRKVLLGAVANAKRNVGRPLLRFKDCVKRDLTSFGIEHREWEKLAEDRDRRKLRIAQGVQLHDTAWFEKLATKRAKQQDSDNMPAGASVALYACSRCGRSCRSRIGLHSHQRKCPL